MYRRLQILALLLACSCGAALAQVPAAAVTGERVPCTGGRAAGFSCRGVDLLAFLPIADLGGATVRVDTTVRVVTLNDIWGWTDPQTKREYALVGRSDGTAFVDVTDPLRPRFLGLLPSHGLIHAGGSAGKLLHDEKGAVSAWRDVKVYRDHAFVVADNAGAHGMQVFDLTQLRTAPDTAVTFAETAHYALINSAHNVAINEETGFAYVVGAGGGGTTCGGGLHMVDVRDPRQPRFAGCFADPATGRARTGYTHDAQCVVYRGPDAAHRGREICIGSNETALSIADVTDKAAPVALSTGTYPTARYVHQGWLTEDHRYFLQDDELDEGQYAFNTRTIVWDLSDLDAPRVLTEHFGTTRAIDHNQYVLGNFTFQANYTSGLRILDISRIDAPREVAFFDTVPATDGVEFDGAWSNYPYFPSGTVVVSSIRQGLFVLDPLGAVVSTGAETGRPAARAALGAAHPNPFRDEATITLTVERAQRVAVVVSDLLGRPVARLHDGLLPAGEHPLRLSLPMLPAGTYLVRATGETFSDSRTVVKVR